MRLYPKKLRNIEDLEREKKRLLKQANQLDKEELLSFGDTGKKDKSKDKAGAGDLISGLLSIDSPLLSAGVDLLQKRFLNNAANGDKRKKAPESGEPVTGVKKSHIAVRFAKEFIGGYLKWKAIELSYKGIKLVVKKSKEKKKKKAENQP